MIDRNCSARSAALSALNRYPKTLPQTPHQRVDPMGPQGPPVPSAPLRCAPGAPLRGRVPLWTIGTTRRPQSKMLPPPNKRGS